MQKKRQTAYKFWIKDLMDAKANIDGDGRMFFKVNGKDVVRVNVLAAVIYKYVSESGNYVFLTLDDGSGQIRLKTWNEDTQLLTKAEIGDSVLCVGKIGLNNNEIFLKPEAIKKMENPEWDIVRKLELLKLHGKPEGEKKFVSEEPEELSQEAVVEEVVVSNSPSVELREKVISAIEVADADGVEEGEVVKEVGGDEEAVLKVVQGLLSEGEIYQPKKGFLKLIG